MIARTNRHEGETEMNGSRRWRLLLFGLVSAFLASGWAWAVACESCRASSDLVGGNTLAPVGAVAYAALLGLAFVRGPSRIVFIGVSIAAGAHFVLMGLLLQKGIFCAPCFAAGISAWVAQIAAKRLDEINIKRASALLPLAGFVALASVHGLAWTTKEQDEKAARTLPEARKTAHAGEAENHALTLTAYIRPGCHWCDVLESEVLPTLKTSFPEMRISMKSAPEDIATPTIIVSGNGLPSPVVYPGLPETKELIETLQIAKGRRP